MLNHWKKTKRSLLVGNKDEDNYRVVLIFHRVKYMLAGKHWARAHRNMELEMFLRERDITVTGKNNNNNN